MRFLAILLMFLSLAAVAQEKQPVKDATLFTISHQIHGRKGKTEKLPVTNSEFIYLYKKNHGKKEDFTEAKENDYLTLLINFKLKVTEARDRGLDTTAAFRKEFEGYKSELKKPYLAAHDELDKLAKEAYENMQYEVKASHILIGVKQDAAPADTLIAWQKTEALRKRALAGEDFEKLARENSEDPSVKQNGGSLGYFSSFQMVYPFEKAAYATPVGGISPVLKTRFGYHILKVFDKIPSRGEVEISHILLRTNGTPEDAKVKNRAFEIFDQAKANRPWDDLAREYSEDPNTKNTGGRLKPFGPGVYKSVPEFDQAAFVLKNPGDISDPFQSRVGWHIIRLERKIPLKPYSEIEATLKRQVARDERLQISKTNQLQKRKADSQFKENTTTRDQIIAAADSSLFTGRWQPAVPAPSVLFAVDGKDYTAGDFIAFSNRQPRAKPQNPGVYVRQLLTNFTEEKLSAAEERRIIAAHPEYKLLLSEYEEGILLFEIMEKEVWNKASEDTTGQRKYYQSHAGKYKAGDRVEARIFSTPDKNFFSTIRAKIASGDSITTSDIRKFKTAQNKRAWERGDSKIIDKINWVPGPHETEADGNYYLVDIIRLIAPGTKSFEEARASVISDYQDQLEKEWLSLLHEKYPVKVNKSAKKAVIAELNK